MPLLQKICQIFVSAILLCIRLPGLFPFTINSVKYESSIQLVEDFEREFNPSQGHYVHRTTGTEKKTDFHASSGIRNHDLSVRAGAATMISFSTDLIY
jgi:hypothetical protein